MTIEASDAMARKIKRHIHGRLHEAFIRTPLGWHEVSQSETRELLKKFVHVGTSTPSLRADSNAIHLLDLDFRSLCQLPYELLTARDIYWLLHRGRGGGMKDVERELRKIPWDLIFHTDTSISIRVTATASRLYHEGRIKDLATTILESYGLKVVSKDESSQLFDLRIVENELTASLSLAGTALYKRGYKSLLAGKASVHEDVAAAAIQWSLGLAQNHYADACFQPSIILVPFAGSGTFGFEAVLQLGAVPSFIFGRSYAFEQLRCTPQASIAHIRKKLQERVNPETPRIHFIEKDETQYQTLQENIAHFSEKLSAASLPPSSFELSHGDVFKKSCDLPDEDIFLPLNPPYGFRLEDHSAAQKIFDRTAVWLRALKDGQRRVCGFIFIPSEPLARRFAKSFDYGIIGERTFSHGGRPTTALAFAL